ncbi:ferrochelatase [Pararhodospirillum oryzae]|uniref:Ferrochelatase n=1 Tax=Pararhodospirillum oryzae TaxID=478448 RepID=A0A512H3N5_9PROT|nr:ferrochelatase [Pararhodospirillum oryzae]GEO80051.1 ferrochelatase [Pararhodospirillum oryzae]
MARVAVVLFNLGGPNSLEAVRPFLFNLFNDPAIMNVPGPIRYALAKVISWRRAPIARDIYARLGGHSPLLEQTQIQAEALESLLAERGHDVHCFVAMRYWEPFISEAVARVQAMNPDHLILLPLYPQFSGTTAGSSLAQWAEEAQKAGLEVPTNRICCYPTEPGLVAAMAELTAVRVAQARRVGEPVVLFSAHGLPRKIIEAGDPYQKQVEETVAAVVDRLGAPTIEARLCFQSRVGPMEWIGPSTEDEITRAGAAGRPVVVVPVAFVSEHSETLVELDLEYAHLASHKGVPLYLRVPTVGRHPAFIGGLADLVERAVRVKDGPSTHINRRICDTVCRRCPNRPTAA